MVWYSILLKFHAFAEAKSTFVSGQSIHSWFYYLFVRAGAHTIGFVHCGFFSDRVYDFQNTGIPDPSMDLTLVTSLKKVCPPPDQNTDICNDPKVFLDGTQGSSFSFDNGFYHEVLHNRAILQIDQELLYTDVTSDLAATYAGDVKKFRVAFSNSIIKMGNINVLTGNQGEIRANCSKINS